MLVRAALLMLWSYLINKGADIKQVAKDKRTVLHSACIKGNLEMVKYLVDGYPDFLHMLDDDE